MIVEQCPDCLTLSPVPHLGVILQGLMPSHVWQMGVTHYAEFRKLKYIHVWINPCSGFLFLPYIWKTPLEMQLIDHCLQAFNAVGLPKVINQWASLYWKELYIIL